MAFKNKLGAFVNKMQNKLSKSVSGITTSNGMLHNKVLLYVVFIFSLLNLFLFTNTGNYTSVVVFLLIGFLTSFFSKNMLVILLLSLILTNILKYGSSLSEGFEEGAKNKEDEDDEGFEEGAKGRDEEDEEGFEEGATGDKEDEEGFEKRLDGKEDEEGTKDKSKENEKEGLEDLKKYADNLMKTISGLNKQIDKFSKFEIKN
jgi:hypothetical protein